MASAEKPQLSDDEDADRNHRVLEAAKPQFSEKLIARKAAREQLAKRRDKARFE